MTYKTINFETTDSVAYLALNAPPLNVMTIEMMTEITNALETLKSQPTVRVIVIKAAEGCKAFSAGVDIADHTADKVDEMIHIFHRIFRLLIELNIPTLAVVNGAALGGGCELATFCDIIVASERAKFGQPEIKVGVFPPVAAVVWPRLMPHQQAMELLLTGEIITAAKAYNIGFVNRVVPPEELTATTVEFINKLSNLSGRILRYARQAVTMSSGEPFNRALSAVEDLYLKEMMQAKDTQEGLAAFMEKRPPTWTHN